MLLRYRRSDTRSAQAGNDYRSRRFSERLGTDLSAFATDGREVEVVG